MLLMGLWCCRSSQLVRFTHKCGTYAYNMARLVKRGIKKKPERDVKEFFVDDREIGGKAHPSVPLVKNLH